MRILTLVPTPSPSCVPGAPGCPHPGEGGGWLRIFVAVAVVGIVATAWFLLKGYRDQGGPGDQ